MILKFKKYFNKFPWKKLYFLILILILYNIGNYIPIPGINLLKLKYFLKIYNNENLINIFNFFFIGNLFHFSIFTLNIIPYILASTIIEILFIISKYFRNLKKKGNYGYYKIIKYTKYIALIISLIQSLYIILFLFKQKYIILNLNISFICTTVLTLITGLFILIWISEKINKKGLGNGISMIIFCNIIISLKSIFKIFFKFINYNIIYLILFTFILLFSIFIIIFFEKSQKNIDFFYIKTNYYKNYLPLKLNITGIFPMISSMLFIIYSNSILNLLIFFFPLNKFFIFIKNIKYFFLKEYICYILFYIFIIIFFYFFYILYIFNYKEISDNLKKNNIIIYGIRPGLNTYKYIYKIVLNLKFINLLYIIFFSILPEILILYFKTPFYLGGISLFIVIIILIDFIEQIQNNIILYKYNIIMKKINFKNKILYESIHISKKNL